MWAQCAAYASALKECEGIKTEEMVIVNIKKTGGILVKYSQDFSGFMNMFLGALLIHRQQNKIKRGAFGVRGFLKQAWVTKKTTQVKKVKDFNVDKVNSQLQDIATGRTKNNA